MVLRIFPNNKRFNHMYGWPWIMESIAAIDVERDVLLDPFVDATFDCAHPPTHTTAWVGIIHHPFMIAKTVYLHKPEFRASLRACVGLIVHDETLKTCLKRYTHAIKIHVLKHPGRVDWEFSLRAWFENEAPLVVTVGRWLRHQEAMALYTWHQETYTDVHFLRTKRPLTPVTLHGASRAKYTGTLRANIMGMCFVDASASNALIECILSCTPVIVNRLPQIVEYLGPDYPLYFSFDETTTTVTVTTKQVWQAYLYLKARRETVDLSLPTYIDGVRRALSGDDNRITVAKKLPQEIIDMIGGYYSNVYFTMMYCTDHIKLKRPDTQYPNVLGCFKWHVY